MKRQLELLKQVVDLGNLPAIQTQLAVLETRLVALEKFETEIRRVAVIDDRVNKLEEWKVDSGKRGWQVVYIAAGVGFALLS